MDAIVTSQNNNGEMDTTTNRNFVRFCVVVLCSNSGRRHWDCQRMQEEERKEKQTNKKGKPSNIEAAEDMDSNCSDLDISDLGSDLDDLF